MSEDLINHPTHYADGWSNGAEVIDITEHLNFNRGNAVKYIARAGKKDPEKELEDLLKASWYLDREINRLEEAKALETISDGPPYIIGKDFIWGTGTPKWTIHVGSADEEPVELDEPQPRVWNSLYVTPWLVRVRDNDGDVWEHHEDKGWRWTRRGRGDLWHEVTDVRDFDDLRPFTEILESA